MMTERRDATESIQTTQGTIGDFVEAQMGDTESVKWMVIE
jgi:hypothetical protein